jgi:hypothetical protein
MWSNTRMSVEVKVDVAKILWILLLAALYL